MMVDDELKAIPCFGPDMMEIGQKLVVKAGGSGVEEIRQRRYKLHSKFKSYGLFVGRNGIKECFTWWEVYRLARTDTVVVDKTISCYRPHR